jgi:hypothetical protein
VTQRNPAPCDGPVHRGLGPVLRAFVLTPRCRVGVLAPVSGPLASCRSIMASVRATGFTRPR